MTATEQTNRRGAQIKASTVYGGRFVVTASVRPASVKHLGDGMNYATPWRVIFDEVGVTPGGVPCGAPPPGYV